MRADEETFLDPSSIAVVFTHDRVVMIGDDPTIGSSAPSPEGHGG
jgi:hypothetical protein